MFDLFLENGKLFKLFSFFSPLFCFTFFSFRCTKCTVVKYMGQLVVYRLKWIHIKSDAVLYLHLLLWLLLIFDAWIFRLKKKCVFLKWDGLRGGFINWTKMKQMKNTTHTHSCRNKKHIRGAHNNAALTIISFRHFTAIEGEWEKMKKRNNMKLLVPVISVAYFTIHITLTNVCEL